MLTLDKEWLIDSKGRKVLLRGVNLGGSSKVPSKPNGATHIKTDLAARDPSFVGRPFPLKDAPIHFQRIKHWGFNSIRFVITWEAIEHSNPHEFDKEYLEYLEEVLKLAEKYRLYTIIDPHQDVWSRASGGDGAPSWTFEKVGLDLHKFNKTEAAFVMQYRYDPQDKEAYPEMSWMQNAGRFAAATMWTLFFGGTDFASSCQIDARNVQDFLQHHFINAFQQVAIRIKDNPYVIGFETLNEPSSGWIGHLVDGSDLDVSKTLHYSFMPFDAMLTAAGFPREIPYRAVKRMGIKEIRRDKLNPEGVCCWLDESKDIWRREGVWGLNEQKEPIIFQNEYFKVVNGRPVNFVKDYFFPFLHRYSKAIREVIPHAMIFLVAPLEARLCTTMLSARLPENIVNAPHWYDEPTIGMKRFMGKASYDTIADKIVLGTGNIQKMFTRQLRTLEQTTGKVYGQLPTVIGEFGLCYDLDAKAAYQVWKTNPAKAWKTHIQALSMYYNALDANLLHALQWNYTADNDNRWGDQWNLEDFSIFSVDQQTTPNDISSGGRAIEGFCRPRFVSVAGTPLKMGFSRKNRVFKFEFDADTRINAPTILFVPEIQYPTGYEVELSEGEFEITEDSQLIGIHVGKNGIHTVIIKPKQ